MSNQISLAEALMDYCLGLNEKLKKIDALIDWERLAHIVAGVRPARMERPRCVGCGKGTDLWLQDSCSFDLSPKNPEAAKFRLEQIQVVINGAKCEPPK